jgi:hypothetical protein
MSARTISVSVTIVPCRMVRSKAAAMLILAA